MSLLRRRRFPLAQGGWLSVVEGGPRDGSVVLLLHGAVGSSGNWSFQLEHLAARYRVVAPELRGHGESPWPGPSEIEDFYADVEQVLEWIGEPVALVGHSFGGCLAAMLADRHPDRIRCLALINTGGHVPQSLMLKVMLWMSGLTGWFRRHYPWMVNCSGGVSRWLLTRVLPEWDCWALFPRLSMPVVVLLGRMDLLIPARFGERLAKLMPGAKVKVIPWAGHVLMAEKPDLVNAELEALFGPT